MKVIAAIDIVSAESVSPESTLSPGGEGEMRHSNGLSAKPAHRLLISKRLQDCEVTVISGSILLSARSTWP
jgi:hypothetical protein